MKCRLLILTEIIAPYRIPVFNALARHPDVDLHVIFMAETDPTIRHWRVYTDEIRFSYEILPSWRTRLGEHTVLVNQRASAALLDADPDVILCGGYNYLISWQAQRWARRNNVPFLLWSESTANDRRKNYRFVEALKLRFFQHCDGFVVPGRSAERYVHQMGAGSKPVFTAPNAVDNARFAQHAASARADASRVRTKLGLPSRYYLFVGRLIRSKGVYDLLEAYSCLGEDLRSEVGLVFVGDGPQRAELELRGRQISPGSVQLPGFVHRDELASYYALADCFVFPTHSDTWGLVVNEAMACTLPIICSRVAGCVADLIHENGRVVSAGSIGELACVMNELARDAGLRRQMSSSGRAIIHEYSPESCAARIAGAALFAHKRRGDSGIHNNICSVDEPQFSSLPL